MKRLSAIPLKTMVIVFSVLAISGIGVASTGIITRSNGINLNQGLVAKWQFNGDAVDSSGNGFNGAVNGATATEDRFGNPAGALDFDGSNDWVSMSGGANLGISGDMSLSFWVNPDDNSTGYFFDNRGPGSFWLLKNYSGYTINFENRSRVNPPGWTLGEWYHIVVTNTPSGSAMYLNGVQVDTGSGETASITTNLRAGTRYTNSSYINAQMDDVTLYDREISQAEVNALYSAQSEASEVSVGGLQSGLAGWWKLDGDGKDSTPYANHGQVFGATATSDRNGSANQAYDFNGSSDYIALPKFYNSSGALSQLTVSAWVKVDPGAGGWSILDFDRSEYFTATISGNVTGTNKVGFHTAGSGIHDMSSNSNVADGQWHLVTWQYDGVDKIIYIDGVEDARAVNPHGGSGLGTGTTRYGIIGDGSEAGTFNGGGNNDYFDGIADEIRLYERALSVDEIKILAESYKPEISISSLSKGLIADWDFNGDAKDKTPYSNHATVNGATLTSDRMGLTESAYNFDGVNDYIEVPAPSISTAPNLFTVTGWIKPSSSQSSRFITPASVGIDQFIQYTGSSQLIRVVVVPAADTSGSAISSPVNSVPVGEWTHWAVSIDDKTVKLYINGVQVASQTVGHEIAGWAGHWDVGQRGNGTFWLDGVIDDLKIYNRALTASEVERLYETY